MAARHVRLATSCVVVGVLLALLGPAAAATVELLRNGGFEQGTTHWNGPSLSTSGCEPHGGSLALSVPNLAQQDLPEPVGNGVYILNGWLKAKDGPASASVSFAWFDADNEHLGTASESVTAGDSYASFGLQADVPGDAHGLRVRITAQGGPICIDDLTLDGPATLPSPTATSPQQGAATATNTPVQAATSKPTATPKPTSTPRPTATSESSPTFEFTNGGFEDGLRGWSKFGGTLAVVSSPVRSGHGAGHLTSNTDSTKWAFQTVLVDPSRHYEFAGYVAAGSGVTQAYLRISWYGSPDGSGTAIATTDSTERLEVASAYTYLTTGAVVPPPGARSAKPRVVMTPGGTAPAAIFFDDLGFGPVQPPAPTATAESQAEPDASRQTASVPAAQAGSADGAASPSTGPESSATPEASTSEVRSAAVVVATASTLPTGPLPLTRGRDGGVPLIWLGATALLLAAMAAAYWHARGRAG